MILNPLTLQPKTRIEESTYDLLLSLDIASPEQINLEYICNSLNIDLLYTNTRSRSTSHPTQTGWYQIFINYDLPEREQREMVAHELGHILYHSGNQLFMNRDFIQLQEIQTEHFAGYLLVPFFMFNELPDFPDQAIYFIAEKFNITLALAKKKYDQLMSRQFEYRYQYIG